MSNTPILAAIDIPGGCPFQSTTSVTGDTIRTDLVFANCGIGFPPFSVQGYATFGPLPPSDYTYDVYFTFPDSGPNLADSRAVIVTPAPFPPQTPLVYALLP
jgi:hypothetical protein